MSFLIDLFLILFFILPVFFGYYHIYMFFSGYRLYHPKHETDLLNDDGDS